MHLAKLPHTAFDFTPIFKKCPDCEQLFLRKTILFLTVSFCFSRILPNVGSIYRPDSGRLPKAPIRSLVIWTET